MCCHAACQCFRRQTIAVAVAVGDKSAAIFWSQPGGHQKIMQECNGCHAITVIIAEQNNFFLRVNRCHDFFSSSQEFFSFRQRISQIGTAKLQLLMKDRADAGGTIHLIQPMLKCLPYDGFSVPTGRQRNNLIHSKIHFGWSPDNHDAVLDNVLPANPKIALLSGIEL